MARKKLEELLKSQRIEKRKVNLYLSVNLWDRVERYAEAYGYGKRKSEFVEKLLDYALEELERLRSKKKGPKNEPKSEPEIELEVKPINEDIEEELGERF